MRLIKRLARFTHATHFLRDHVAQAVAPADVRAAKSAARHAIYLTTNGVPVTGEWISVENELRYVSVFFQLGVRMMHLTYNRRNILGDGCGEPGSAGLSDFGRAAITEMNRLGVIVDVAYRSRNAVAEYRKIPRRARQRVRWEALWPQGALGGATAAQVESMAWTNWPLFTVGLVQRGYSDLDIRKVLGENVMRVCKANFDGVA